jgi:hypothetical protein
MLRVADAFHEHACHAEIDHRFRDIGAADGLNNEVQICRFVKNPALAIDPVGEEMLDPWPAITQRVQERLRADAVSNIRGGVRFPPAREWTNLA